MILEGNELRKNILSNSLLIIIPFIFSIFTSEYSLFLFILLISEKIINVIIFPENYFMIFIKFVFPGTNF